jgi:hypothetical protein
MHKVKIVPFVFFIMLYGLSACNLPGSPGENHPPRHKH